MRKNLLIFVILVLATATVGGTIYKWVDEKGVTHYSEQPPSNQKARKLEIQPAPPTAGSEGTPSTKNMREREEEFRQRQEAREREAKLEERAAQWKMDAAKVAYLISEFGGNWVIGPSINLEQQCQEQYNLSCDALLNWKSQAIQKCKDDRGSNQDCENPAYLLRFKPQTSAEQLQRAIQQRSRERRLHTQ